MDEVLQILQDGGRLNDLIAVEILKGSNEKALDILRVCGCEAIVPGTIYAPLNDIAKFYQCRPSYLTTILNRFGITPAKTPADVMKCGFPYFLWHFNLEKQFAVSCKYNTYTMIDKETNKKYEFNHSNKAGNLYSARVVLAMAMLMYFGRTINQEAMGSKLYKKLLSSTYADSANKAMADRRAKLQKMRQIQRQSTVDADAEAEAQVSENNAAVLSNGTIVMTADFLAGLIKTAVHEAVSEFAKTVTPAASHAPAAPTAPPGNPPLTRTRISKPDNWEYIVGMYEDGAITKTEAAQQAGMSASSFDYYRRGYRQFVS